MSTNRTIETTNRIENTNGNSPVAAPATSNSSTFFGWLGESGSQIFAWLRSLNWPLILWNVITLPVIAVVYWTISSHGLRMLIPIFGTRLSKIQLPWFSYLARYEEFHDLTIAHLMVLLLLGFVWYFLTIIIHVVFHGHDSLVSPTDRRPNYYIFVLTLAAVIVSCDAIIFYYGLFEFSGGWGNSSWFAPFVATVLYTSLLVALAMVHVQLSVRHKQTQ